MDKACQGCNHKGDEKYCNKCNNYDLEQKGCYYDIDVFED